MPDDSHGLRTGCSPGPETDRRPKKLAHTRGASRLRRRAMSKGHRHAPDYSRTEICPVRSYFVDLNAGVEGGIEARPVDNGEMGTLLAT